MNLPTAFTPLAEDRVTRLNFPLDDCELLSGTYSKGVVQVAGDRIYQVRSAPCGGGCRCDAIAVDITDTYAKPKRRAQTPVQRAAAKARADRRNAARTAELGHLSSDQIQVATRGLSVGDYCEAFAAGARNSGDLDAGAGAYMNRGTKTVAHEAAYLDGNTYGEDPAAVHLRERAENPDQY